METFWGYDWSLTCLPVLFQRRTRHGLWLKWPNHQLNMSEFQESFTAWVQVSHTINTADINQKFLFTIMLTCCILHGNITQQLIFSRNGIISQKILLAVVRRISPRKQFIYLGCGGVLQLPKGTVWNWLAHAKTLYFFKERFFLRWFCIHKVFLQDSIVGYSQTQACHNLTIFTRPNACWSCVGTLKAQWEMWFTKPRSNTQWCGSQLMHEQL